MGLFMLCAWHNFLFTALPRKHNGQAALNSTMAKRPCGSLISHVFSKKIRFTLLYLFLYLQIFAARITFLQGTFATFLVVFETF